jgi:hypothetical protein
VVGDGLFERHPRLRQACHVDGEDQRFHGTKYASTRRRVVGGAFRRRPAGRIPPGSSTFDPARALPPRRRSRSSVGKAAHSLRNRRYCSGRL